MKKLFLVDADPFTVCVLDVSLRSAGYEVTTAADGVEAWSKLESSPPHLLIADTRLPKLDGFALVRKLKDRPELSRIPVIFLASQESVADRERALELGVEDYLAKPAFLRELVARIDLLIARSTRQRVAAGHTQSFGRGRLTGSTADFALVDILQSFERTRKGGTLYVRQGTQEVQIAFRDGRPIDAHMGEIRGEESIYRALVWKEASFEIDFKPVTDDDVIGKSTHAILLKGMRRLDDWVRLCEQVKPLATLLDVHPPLLVERLARMGELPDDLESMLHLPLRAAVAAGHAEPPREDPSERSVRAAEPVTMARATPPAAPPSTPIVAATMTPPAPSEPPPSVRPAPSPPVLAVVPVASSTPVLSTVSSPVVSGSVRPTPSQRPSAAPWTVDPEGDAPSDADEGAVGVPHGVPGSGRRATFALGVAAAVLLVAGGVYSLRAHPQGGGEAAKAGEDNVAAAAPAAPESAQTAAAAPSAEPALAPSAEVAQAQEAPAEAPVDSAAVAAEPAPAGNAAPVLAQGLAPVVAPVVALPLAPPRIVRETAIDVNGAITSKSPLVRDAERALLKGDTDRAQALSQQAVDTNPSDADAWLTLAAARKASGDMPSARQAYRNCIEQAHTVDVDHCRILAAQ